jgi:hypothetical protein
VLFGEPKSSLYLLLFLGFVALLAPLRFLIAEFLERVLEESSAAIRDYYDYYLSIDSSIPSSVRSSYSSCVSELFSREPFLREVFDLALRFGRGLSSKT